MTVFGENLKRIRLERNMSQDDLALLLGTSKQVISRYETGQRSPKVSVVAAFAEKLGVSISMLTTGEDDVNEQEMRELLESLRNDPMKRTMFRRMKNATPDDVRRAVAILDALEGTGGDEE